jgi:NADH-quinone oxidoreductase subunit H
MIYVLLKLLFILALVATVPALTIWAERRQSAMIQGRIGPHRAGVTIGRRQIRLAGLLHPLADGIKSMWKEDFVPPRADRLLHALAPIVAFVSAVAVFAVIPFGGVLYPELAGQVLWSDVLRPVRAVRLQLATIDPGMLYIFAVSGAGALAAAMAGVASDNKYALLGAMRGASQLVSYEVCLGMSLVGCFMVMSSVRLEEMVEWQRQHVWGIIEYSGMKMVMFVFGELIETCTTSALLTAIFLGGHHLPLLRDHGFQLGSLLLPLPHGCVVGLEVAAFLIKMGLLIWLQVQLRWTLPRMRYDQIMKLCWKGILPLALLNIVITGLLVLLC